MKIKFGLYPIIRIKEVLDQHDLTQKELAEMIGETPQQLSKWVNGVEPCLSALGRIAMTLGVSIHDLVWFAGEDADFNINSTVYIRGEATQSISHQSETLDVLKQYYRWTEEETAGVKVVFSDKGDITLRCVGEGVSDAFITWAKKDRECMYRL